MTCPEGDVTFYTSYKLVLLHDSILRQLRYFLVTEEEKAKMDRFKNAL